MKGDKFAMIAAMGAALSAAAHAMPHLAHKMELAALQEKQFAAMAALGVADASAHRVMRFVVALAQSQIVPNSDLIIAANQFNLRRLARGEELTPADISQWALSFWDDEAGSIFDDGFRQMHGFSLGETGLYFTTMLRFADDAERIWQQTQ